MRLTLSLSDNPAATSVKRAIMEFRTMFDRDNNIAERLT
jgi:hypothetical protein